METLIVGSMEVGMHFKFPEVFCFPDKSSVRSSRGVTSANTHSDTATERIQCAFLETSDARRFESSYFDMYPQVRIKMYVKVQREEATTAARKVFQNLNKQMHMRSLKLSLKKKVREEREQHAVYTHMEDE